MAAGLLLSSSVPTRQAGGSSPSPRRVLFVHGLESGPNGYKVRELRAQGMEVVACDMHGSLWDVRRANSIARRMLDIPSRLFRHWPWRWLASSIDDAFEGCLNVQRAALLAQAEAVDVLIGSSWGGAVAAALLAEGSWSGPTILLCPALQAKGRLFGSESELFSADAVTARLARLPAALKARCLLVHGDCDTTVPLSDSQALAESTSIALEVIPGGDHTLRLLLPDGRLARMVQGVLAVQRR
jgi:pimeloyl-ACP methyl ester carboxylesterase